MTTDEPMKTKSMEEAAVSTVQDAIELWDEDVESGRTFLFWVSILAEAFPEVYDGKI